MPWIEILLSVWVPDVLLWVISWGAGTGPPEFSLDFIPQKGQLGSGTCFEFIHIWQTRGKERWKLREICVRTFRHMTSKWYVLYSVLDLFSFSTPLPTCCIKKCLFYWIWLAFFEASGEGDPTFKDAFLYLRNWISQLLTCDISLKACSTLSPSLGDGESLRSLLAWSGSLGVPILLDSSPPFSPNTLLQRPIGIRKHSFSFKQNLEAFIAVVLQPCRVINSSKQGSLSMFCFGVWFVPLVQSLLPVH